MKGASVFGGVAVGYTWGPLTSSPGCGPARGKSSVCAERLNGGDMQMADFILI